MTTEEIRLRCYQLAFEVRGSAGASALRQADGELAAAFAAYCKDDTLRCKALSMAVAQSDSRGTPESIKTSANEILNFMNPPKAAKKVTPQKNTSRLRR